MMTSPGSRDLTRLFRPVSIAVIGGGFWGANVIAQCRKMGFDGDIWPVHPTAQTLGGLPCYASVEVLPGVPDACFIGVNRHTTIDVVTKLSAAGAGGAVCFASGFSEAEAEDSEGANLQARLLKAAGNMPVLGPNCYGFINYLDGALLWPDQHGGTRQETGVAIVTQSSNIAINLTMQRRGLPVAYMATAGNQAQIGLADIGAALLRDNRVTALGLHIEGFGDIRAFEALAATARELGKPVVVLKVGKSQQARAATVSHTASLAGQDAGAQALLNRLGIPRLNSLPEFLETLKLLHVTGPLKGNNIASISCSGGEASLMADTALGRDLLYPPLTNAQKTDLRAALGPMVALANPLDYHTYIWTDTAAMTRVFAAMMQEPVNLTFLVVDFPRTDRCDDEAWDCAIDAATGARRQSGSPVAVVAGLQENMPEEIAQKLMENGVVPMMGMDEALAAAEAAAFLGRNVEAPPPVQRPGSPIRLQLLAEADAKSLLAAYGLSVPNSKVADNWQGAARAAQEIGYPVVLKGQGVAHKTEAGAVCVNLQTADEVAQAAQIVPGDSFLVEQMITGAVAELLIGVVRDPAHGFVLTLAAGGVLTELLDDSASLLVPSSPRAITQALAGLKISKLLGGYRGAQGADIDSVVNAVLSVQNFVVAHADRLEEIEVNPLLCTPTGAVAADALVRLGGATGWCDWARFE